MDAFAIEVRVTAFRGTEKLFGDRIVDDTGHSTSALLNIGGGVTVPFGKWFGDVSYRFTPIFTPNQATKVSRFNFGVARRF